MIKVVLKTKLYSGQNLIKEIEKLYREGSSAAEIGNDLGISWRKVIYLMEKHNIKRRSRSEATYRKLNPEGNPFKIKRILSKDEEQLKTLALGLYLAEGTKSNSISVRLSNSDPNLIKIFLNFLKNICGVKLQKIKLWLTLHSDISATEAKLYWSQCLNIPLSRFSESVIMDHRGNGLFRKKSLYGTVTVCVHNIKLRRLLQNWINETVDKHIRPQIQVGKCSDKTLRLPT
jgi:hypothetical protein